ncbi:MULTISPECIES: amino acid synthesis family protein [Arthrobacter]|uniref:Amino acid synthesis family protein n=1 Tax=Arthrobacter terricola TaxID=2547396 RepID=A0A4R5KSP6_9MICC|nr:MULTISPECIES: amino acid synthesis family protein [Arthrobacter]MBT8160715.1 amino acid synthesis family protein [Arthrobacter sp. GN70]TDF97867.1 amino acid synthesis family protein [Arthrobacter terricola]
MSPDNLGIRKIVFYSEEILSENGQAPAVTAVRATAAAVVANPWLGGKPSDDLSPEVMKLAPVLARKLTNVLAAELGGVDAIEAFGKAAIVGTAGEIEHGAALIHTPFFGNLVREFFEGESIICFADDRGDAGSNLVVPLWHKNAAATRTHYQTISTRVGDAPLPGEIVVVLGASTGPRPHSRIGDRLTDPAVKADTIGELIS